MHEQDNLEQTLARLKQERDEADRLYNDALTLLDRAVMRMPELPHPPPPYDEHQITPLNESCPVIAAPAAHGGWKGRLAGFIWRTVAPTLEKQARFNSLLVDHLNRNVAAHREAERAIRSTIALLGDRIAQLIDFQSRLITYLQQITLYVDTRDRAAAGQSLIVNEAVNAVAEDLAKRSESMVAREQRFASRVESLTEAHEELRTLVGVTQQASLTLKRELERLTGGSAAAARTSAPGDPTSGAASGAFASALDSYKYVGFEDQFRGSQEAIRARLESYLPYFEGASDVLDVGCGRGEFLDLLKGRGVSSRGLDLNHEMAELCRARGLDVTESDAVGYLESLADGSLGGLFAAQVVEHLQPGYLLRFLELAAVTLRAGAPIVLETLNPACWTAFFDSFIRDITHVWPLHPETLRYLVLASGFTSARIEFRSPVPPQDRLQPSPAGAEADTGLVETFNANVEKLNARMFTYLDYAIVGRK